MDKELQIVKNLVTIFKDNIDQYSKPSYKEAQLRKEFVDKFFVALGWDVNNDEGRAEKYKEVINEDAVKIAGKNKAPDYAFRIGGNRVFFVETKKPSVNIKEDIDSAFQLRRYAWNSKIPLSILTNFRVLAVYDCKIKPNPKDNPSVGRLLLMDFEDYVSKFDLIAGIFSKDGVLKGSFDRFAESKKGKKGTTEVDDVFLQQIEEWRNDLAKNIARNNPTLSISELNYCVQETINRILFLRICEDRDIEPYERLKNLSKSGDVYSKLIAHFEGAEKKYDSGIFDFKTDKITNHISIDDSVLEGIISTLYYPQSPYDFSVLSIEILGNVYEQFLGKTIRLTPTHQAKVEEKLEVRQAGGVYYTPDFVVDYIIKNTIGKLIIGKSPEEIEKLKILDLASGSGTFLVRAYSYLLDHHLTYYQKNPKKYKKEIYQIKENQWYLTTEVRKKILLNNIFGVDIDPQAVEITKLSLLLKVLENETKESVNQQLKLFQERALPNIDSNIRCGNSLVDSSYFEQTKLVTPTEELQRVKPFDWEDSKKGFGKILQEGKFDVIIGNPPYVKEDKGREAFEWVKQTNLKKYYEKYMDMWYFFTCKSIDLLKEGGYHSFIAQNNWVTSDGASILREKILSETRLLSFFDFNEFKVFKDASIQTMIFVLEKEKTKNPYDVDYYKVLDKKISVDTLRGYFSLQKKNDKILRFRSEIDPTAIEKTITFANVCTSRVIQKISSMGNFHLKEDDIGNGIDVLQDFITQKHLDILKDSQFKKGDGVFVLRKDEVKKADFNKTEMNKIKPYFTSEELTKYYGNPENRYFLMYADLEVRSNIDKYLNFKKHLDKFRKILTSDFKPYGLHRPREQKFFEGEKIFSLRKTPKVSFTYTDFPCYVSRAFLIVKPSGINLKYLTGILNSKLVNFWFYHMGKRQGEQLQVDKTPLMDLPIRLPSNEKEKELQREIVLTVNEIIEIKKKIELVKLENELDILEKKVASLENKLDNAVFCLYGITEEEKETIENGF
jgi:adenine-specific DNA-methyltransferase